MRVRLILASVLAIGAAFVASAQEAPIQGTIRQQLEAFRAEDVVTAFSYASPKIRQLFGTAENFGAMVAQGYPMVWQPGDVQMLELRTVAGNLWQRVMITDGAGETYLLDYMMVEGPEGWQINAVQLLPDQGVGA